jgi:uncharacterized membrane protein YgdD (TMEM256/DUF423 family)
MEKTLIIVGGVLGALGVAIGAFGAHGLRTVVGPDMLANFETGARYHLIHALALFAAAFVTARYPQSALGPAAGWLFVAGIVFFSGSLYLMALTGQRWLGAITPIGGVAFIAGWLCLVAAAARAT